MQRWQDTNAKDYYYERVKNTMRCSRHILPSNPAHERKPVRRLREICGTHPDLLSSVVQNALRVFGFKLIKSMG